MGLLCLSKRLRWLTSLRCALHCISTGKPEASWCTASTMSGRVSEQEIASCALASVPVRHPRILGCRNSHCVPAPAHTLSARGSPQPPLLFRLPGAVAVAFSATGRACSKRLWVKRYSASLQIDNANGRHAEGRTALRPLRIWSRSAVSASASLSGATPPSPFLRQGLKPALRRSAPRRFTSGLPDSLPSARSCSVAISVPRTLCNHRPLVKRESGVRYAHGVSRC